MGAMSNLAVLWEAEWGGVDTGLGRAVELYWRAIREGNDTHAFSPLSRKYNIKGGESVYVDIPRALDLSSDKCNKRNVR